MGRPSTSARFRRSGCMPCPCERTVRWPSRNSANAQDGAPVPNSGSTVATIVTVEVSRRGNVAIPRVDGVDGDQRNDAQIGAVNALCRASGDAVAAAEILMM